MVFITFENRLFPGAELEDKIRALSYTFRTIRNPVSVASLGSLTPFSPVPNPKVSWLRPISHYFLISLLPSPPARLTGFARPPIE